MSESTGEKTFDPTDHKREEFRKQGKFPRARDAGGIAATAAAVAAMIGTRGAMAAAVRVMLARTLGDASAWTAGRFGGVSDALLGTLATLAVPMAVAAAIGATVAALAQSRGRLETDMIGFKWDRLAIGSRVAQMFSFKHAASETIMALLRVGAVGVVSYRVGMLEVPALLTLTRMPIDSAWQLLGTTVVRVTLSALGALAVIAMIDYARSWLQLESEMKMSRKEIMDETRSQEGDPKSKGRMRQRARAMLRKRSLSNVKKASVVVTNPTHFAVALRYSNRDPAPVVVSKGEDDFALAIRAEARKHGIPILENRALARALYAEVEIGRPVPPSHFAAVARVLAFVFRLKKSRGMQRA